MIREIACVTGASGIIGKQIVAILKAEGYEIRVLSRKVLKKNKRVHLFQRRRPIF